MRVLHEGVYMPKPAENERAEGHPLHRNIAVDGPREHLPFEVLVHELVAEPRVLEGVPAAADDDRNQDREPEEGPLQHSPLPPDEDMGEDDDRRQQAEDRFGEHREADREPHQEIPRAVLPPAALYVSYHGGEKEEGHQVVHVGLLSVLEEEIGEQERRGGDHADPRPLRQPPDEEIGQ